MTDRMKTDNNISVDSIKNDISLLMRSEIP